MTMKTLPSVITVSRVMGLVTVEYGPAFTVKQLASNLMQTLNIDSQTGFSVETILLMDVDFKKLEISIPLIIVTVAARTCDVPATDHRSVLKIEG